ncbi:hypothetical protein ACH4VR_40345 [Streptomyces sp. NPDC020883]|uniref:hypothetical protein n=1 Tax=Streptomyces sp. NPDC020883 TaxID=3365099 RepID=UPI00378B3663
MFVALLVIVAVKYVLTLGATVLGFLRPSLITTLSAVAACAWTLVSVLTVLSALYYAYQWVVFNGDLKPVAVTAVLVVIDTIAGGGVKLKGSN